MISSWLLILIQLLSLSSAFVCIGDICNNLDRSQTHLCAAKRDEDTSKVQNDLPLNKHSRLCLAPMMDYTNKHFRSMVRLISANTLTYTEMVAADELLGEKTDRNVKQFFGQSVTIPEGPSVLQLGGNDAQQMRECAKIYYEFSQKINHNCEYIALNLNCGCPSPSVSEKKCFGAALMKDPSHVTKLVRAMHDGIDGKIPITVKCRIGVHDIDENTPFSRKSYDKISEKKEYERLRSFIDEIASDGIVKNFQIHARIAVLGGSLSPADNRRIPPLKYEYVHRLADQYPDLNFVLNGGIHSLPQVREELDGNKSLAGVMVGRAFCADPWSFSFADELIYEDTTQHHMMCANRRELLEAYGRHADFEESRNDPVTIRRSLVAACAHLFAGEPNAKQFRRELDEISARPERLQRKAKAKVWSRIAGDSRGSTTLASAFQSSTTTPAGGNWDDIQASGSLGKVADVGWDDIQAIDDNTKWDENEPPLSELIKESQRRAHPFHCRYKQHG